MPSPCLGSDTLPECGGALVIRAISVIGRYRKSRVDRARCGDYDAAFRLRFQRELRSPEPFSILFSRAVFMYTC